MEQSSQSLNLLLLQSYSFFLGVNLIIEQLLFSEKGLELYSQLTDLRILLLSLLVVVQLNLVNSVVETSCDSCVNL